MSGSARNAGERKITLHMVSSLDGFIAKMSWFSVKWRSGVLR